MTGVPGRGIVSGGEQPAPPPAPRDGEEEPARVREYVLKPGGGAEAPRQLPEADAPLTAKQRKALATLARRAFAEAGKRGGAEPGESFDDWRHRQVSIATGGRASGLTSATNRQYRAIRGRLRHLAGDGGGAFADAMRDSGERADAEQALHLILAACREFGLSRGYAEAICKARAKGRGLDSVAASAREGDGRAAKLLSQILYTVRNRGRKKRDG